MKGEVSAGATEAAPGIGRKWEGKLGGLHRRHVGGGELDSTGWCRKLRLLYTAVCTSHCTVLVDGKERGYTY